MIYWDKEKFKKFINPQKIESDFYDFESFTNEMIEQQRKALEEVYCQFLQEKGYKIDKPYDIKQLEAIRNDLESKGEFLDCIDYCEFSDDNTTGYHYIIPFFNSISNPISDETRDEIIEKFKKTHRKDK